MGMRKALDMDMPNTALMTPENRQLKKIMRRDGLKAAGRQGA